MNIPQQEPPLSASTLKVFAECERLYGYAFVTPRPWPAPTHADPLGTEAKMEAGQRLHQLIHLHARGLDPRPLARTDERLQRWYTRYKACSLAQPEGRVFSEQKLSLPYGARSLTVKYDRLIQQGEQWQIVDWKTAQNVPGPEHFASDWQARLYPYVLVEAGPLLNDGKSIRPEDVTMVFYYLESGREVRLPYSAEQHARFGTALAAAVERLASASGQFRPTGKTTGRCHKPVCKFYSLCHMAVLPESEFRPEEDADGAEAPLELLSLEREFEFEDAPVWL